FPKYAQLQKILRDELQDTGLDLAVPGGLFGGVIINFKVASEIHKDADDLPEGWCFVLAFGEWTGGDLKLQELGFQIKFGSGTLIGFRSSLISHGNTPV
ncbi:hypothetical protein BC829DRAFT_353813, partial [Chytridium lagenaria]